MKQNPKVEHTTKRLESNYKVFIQKKFFKKSYNGQRSGYVYQVVHCQTKQVGSWISLHLPFKPKWLWKNPMFFFEFKGALIEVKHLKKSNCFALIAITVISCLLSFLWTHCPEKRKESVILNADLSRVQGQCGVTWKMFCHQGRFLTLALNIINQIFDLQFYFQKLWLI